MPAIRFHVRPPHRHVGLYVAGALWGGLSGFLYLGFMRLVEGFGRPNVWVILLVLGIFLLPLLLTAAFVARFCQHYGASYLVGQLVGSCYALGIWGAMWLVNDVVPRWQDMLILIALVIGTGVIAGLICLLFTAIHIHHISQLLAQDGSLCFSCGYDIGHTPSPCCPECGTPRVAPGFALHPVYQVGEWFARAVVRFKYVIALVVVCTMTAFLAHKWPSWRFASRFGQGGFYSRTYYTSGAGDFDGSRMGVEGYQALPDHDGGRALILHHHRTGLFDYGTIQVRLGSTQTAPWIPVGSVAVFARDLSPRVVCDLDDRQSRYVMKHGVPDSLVEALFVASKDAKERKPTSVMSPVEDIIVIPDKYFPDF